ncbi:hypothetical protein K456DRAFT_40574 [Colletotrichum gloeosporioides 23]|nr:hypothetical protein K456DRAFT_40574 [Colletotrichum gloeosporioides 23]
MSRLPMLGHTIGSHRIRGATCVDSRLDIEQLKTKPENAEDCDELRAFDVARDNTLVDPMGNTAERKRLLEGDNARYLAVVPSGAVFTRSSNSKAMATRGPAQPESKYIALSYVWGEQASETSSPEGTAQHSRACVPLPANLPAVVVDALNVAGQMGFDYIWIDKYCINQNNKAEKDGQISQMDSIYYNAEATIIAAAGSNSTYGPALHTNQIS